MNKVIRTPDYPIIETKNGKLHGFWQDDVFHFHGIRYGRAKRFEPAVAEPAWEGVKDAKAYGYVCPLLPDDPHEEGDPMAAPFNSFEMPHVYWPMSEDCLYLNVWTKHIERDAKRPVMVWLHGGGYSAGSAIEIPAYDGHNLSDYGDVVLVNLNHRLNCIGFMDLSSFGDRYKYTGCLGMMDIVLALQWVHDNIGAFGGDPENVTVAGQSGGGGKALALLQMPVADGLYRKLISESGGLRDRPGATRESEKRRWQKLGEKTVELLGLTAETIDEIRTMPYERIAQAAVDAGKALQMPGGLMLFEPSETEGIYTGMYNVAGFREETKDIPVIAGTTLGEFSFMHYLGDKTKYTAQEKRALLKKSFGEDADRIAELFAQIYPGKDELYALSVDAMFRPKTVDFVKARAAFTDAPVYNYQMSVIVPYMGGLAPWHCAEIPFVFRNVDMEPMHCVGHEYKDRLEDQISGAWLAFMRTGDPSTEGLAWEPWTAEHPGRMIFDEACGMDESDDAELMALAEKHAWFPF